MSEAKGKRVVIIGSGPCGLGAATRLHELNALSAKGLPGAVTDWHVYDASPAAGGLACSFVDDAGFTWDVGGHVIFSHYAYFSKLLDHTCKKTGWNEMIREAWVWMRDSWIPYPLQNNIWRLPKADLTDCLDGLVEIQNKSFPKPQNFKDWIDQAFGRGLVRVFMDPYNRKVWAFPPSEMNVEWMGERVATVDLKAVLKNLVEQKDSIGWGPNSTFRFPLRGGTGSIWTNIYEHLPKERFHFSKKVTEVDAAGKTVSFADGTSVKYDYLLSSMPLDQLCRSLKRFPIAEDKLALAASKMKYSSTHVIGFGMEGQPPKHLQTKCWMYFPEDNCPFYRVTVFSNYSKYNCPKPGEQWSLMCEVAESPVKPVDGKTVVEEAEKGLLACKLISPNDKIVSRFHKRLEYGYPTPYFGRDQLCNPIFEELQKHGIYSRGRFGAWKYEVSNQDHTMMQGVEAVDHMLFGSEEMTFAHAGIVNQYKDRPSAGPAVDIMFAGKDK